VGYYGLSERDALEPLLSLARAKVGAERGEWLDDLRRDAPTVVARLEQILDAEVAPAVPLRTPVMKTRSLFDRLMTTRTRILLLLGFEGHPV
jgi:hypothetical protein